MIDRAIAGECPVCGAGIPTRRRFRQCPACGTPLPETFEPQGPSAGLARPDLEDFLNTMNDRLAKTGAEISDRAFNLGCGLGILLLIAWGIAVYFLSGRNWLLLLIAVIVFSLAVLWLVILVTDLSRTRAIARVYREEVQPELEGYCRIRRMESNEMAASAHTLLPDRAPLLSFMPAPPPPEEPGLAED